MAFEQTAARSGAVSEQEMALARRAVVDRLRAGTPTTSADSGRTCSRPLCSAPAEVLLDFDYESRHVVLDWTADSHDPNLLELCATHAERFRPPNGWSFDDVRVDLRTPVDLREDLHRG